MPEYQYQNDMLDEASRDWRTYSLGAAITTLYVAVSGHESVEADYTIPLCTLVKEALVHMKEFHHRERFADVDQECSFLEQVFGLWHECSYWSRK